MNDRGRHPEWPTLAREYEWSRIRDRFSIVLVLLIITVFPSISAPNTRWAWLATTVALAASLMVAIVASGAQAREYYSVAQNALLVRQLVVEA